VNTFSGKSITTQQWKDHLYAYWKKNGGNEKIQALDSIKWDVSILCEFVYASHPSSIRRGSTEKVLNFPKRLNTMKLWRNRPTLWQIDGNNLVMRVMFPGWTSVPQIFKDLMVIK
jgi:hypothetical protein